MEFRDLLKKRREELRITQADVADRLSQLGHETSPKRVGHWETGRNKPPLEDLKFRRALAASLSMSVNELMSELGYIDDIQYSHSREALMAADIVDRLPEPARLLALDLLQSLEKRY